MIRTDRGDEVRARYLIMAVGILNLMKLPVIPGMDEFEGRAFHTARWDYEYTGGSQEDPRLTKLADKVVGVIGVGASGIQALPPLAESAKHVYVFQRTPSAIGERGNRPTDDDFAEQLRPGWQRERMENFSGVMIGRPVERDLVDDGWTLHTARLNNPVVEPDMTGEDIAAMVEAFDYDVMEEHRARIDELVADPAVAAMLKPYYRYGCKRPCFHDEYFARVQQPQRDVGRLPGRRRAHHARTARSPTTPSTSSTASCTPPGSRPSSRRSRAAPATPSSGAAASRWRRSGRTASSACTA